MKRHARFLSAFFAAAVPLILLGSCADKPEKKQEEPPEATQQRTVVEPALLPTRFRQAGYIIKEEGGENRADGGKDVDLEKFQLKVGANIRTNEPIPLREAMKAIVRNKNMSLSWASDVDQELFVDIDISANDNFYEAIDNILRQLDYFHETEGSTLVIKYRETKQYHVAMPFTKQDYETGTGGNLLGSDDKVSKSTKGVIRLDSTGNSFDIWENIEKNINTIIATWSSAISTPSKQEDPAAKTADAGKAKQDAKKGQPGSAEPGQLSRRVSSTESRYTIDKPVGLITVHAPRSLQKRIADYLATLEKEIYKQIMIEAKIVEVQLQDNSSLGINWNTLLKNLSFMDSYAAADKHRHKSKTEEEIKERSSSVERNDLQIDKTLKESKSGSDSTALDGVATGTSTSSGKDEQSTDRTVTDTLTDLAKKGTTAATIITGGAANAAYGGIFLGGFSFESFINALKEQGRTSILSNPKISVMNGQPALITVGRNVTYVEAVETDVDKDNGTVNYKIKTDRILSGIGLALSAVIKKNNDVVMNLVPVTSELVDDIQYMEIGTARIGLPVVNIREMSTTVTIKDGSMLVVGGLISEVDSKEGDFVHGTENIPYLKYLFGYEEKKKTKRELIILLRPRIIN